MFLSDSEFVQGRKKLELERESSKALEQKLKRLQFSPGEIQKALRSRLELQKQLARDVEAYERLKQEGVAAVRPGQSIGETLIAQRIALGLSQGDLATMLGTAEAQVARDERNKYRGLSVRSARRILDTLRAM